jgi:hypothetical protein
LPFNKKKMEFIPKQGHKQAEKRGDCDWKRDCDPPSSKDNPYCICSYLHYREDLPEHYVHRPKCFFDEKCSKQGCERLHVYEWHKKAKANPSAKNAVDQHHIRPRFENRGPRASPRKPEVQPNGNDVGCRVQKAIVVPSEANPGISNVIEDDEEEEDEEDDEEEAEEEAEDVEDVEEEDEEAERFRQLQLEQPEITS